MTRRDEDPRNASSRDTAVMIFVMAVISATIIIIWILSKQGVIPGLWSTILSNSLAVLAVTVLITHMLIVRHYSHQQLVAGSFERREEKR